MSTPGQQLILRLLSQSVEKVNKTCDLDTTLQGQKVSDGNSKLLSSSDTVDDERKSNFGDIFKMSDTQKSGIQLTSKATSNISKSSNKSNIQLNIVSEETGVTTCKRVAENNYNKKVRPYIKHNKNQSFTPEEIDTISKAMEEHGDNVDHKEVARKIGRLTGPVKRKINNLKAAGSNPKKSFTLLEDTMIIETFCKNLKSGHPFKYMKSLTLSELCSLSLTMKRKEQPVLGRWTKILQPWILQYYSGTLNLQIVPMLVNFLVDNYSEMARIEWNSVVLKPEFSGHTESSLKGLVNNIIVEAKRHLNTKEVDLLLLKKFIDQKVKEDKFKNVTDKVKMRQMDVVKYFQEFVVKNDITEIC